MPGGNPLELIAVEVRADIEQLQSGMSGATRVVDASYAQINRAAQDSERAIVRSASNASDAMDGTNRRSVLLGQQFSQMGQQIAAGTSPLQAIAIQLPDISIAMSQLGGEAGALASFFGGPWGIALTTAAAVAASFIPELLGIGDAADSARPKVDAMTAALDRLSQAQGRVTREDFGRARDNLLEKQGAVRAARDRKRLFGSNIGTAASAGRSDADIRDAQAELKKAADIFNLSKIRLQTQDRTDAANRSAEAKSSARSSPSGGRAAARRSGGSATASDNAGKQLERQNQLYDKTKAQFELEQRLADLRAQGTESASMLADMLEARARIEQQFPELAKSTKAEDQQRLQVLLDIQNATIGEAYARRAAKAAAEEQRKAVEGEMKQAEQDIDNIQRQQERQIRTLAGLYQDAFRGGTDAIWENFKEIGLRVVAEVLARFTLSKLAGGSFDLGGAITAAVGSALPGFASGGSMVIGGRGGTDQNTLSLNGRPVARVSAGEHLNIVNPSLSKGSSATIVNQSFTLDARGGITTPELLQYVNSTASRAAAQMGQVVSRGVLKATPTRLSSFQRDGT